MLYNATNIEKIFDKKKTSGGLLSKKSKIYCVKLPVWYLSMATANKFAGTLSSLYPEVGKTKIFLGFEVTTLFDFFMIFVVMSVLASVVLFVLSKTLQKLMHGIR